MMVRQRKVGACSILAAAPSASRPVSHARPSVSQSVMGKSSKRTLDEATAPASDAPSAAAAMDVDASPAKPSKKSKKEGKKDKAAAADGDDAPEASTEQLAEIAKPLGAFTSVDLSPAPPGSR